jgi:hypothetical protein
MNILHLSHQSLPDKRVERAAFTGVKQGHKCFFVGLPPIDTHSLIAGNLFEDAFPIGWTWKNKLHLPHFWGKLKKRCKYILKTVDPDIVHAHDIFAAKLCHEMKIPFVFDSHELWGPKASLKVVKKGRESLWLKRLVSTEYGLRLWEKWQKQIVKDVPTITVSRTIADELREEGGEKIFWVPNFPLAKEIAEIKFQRKYEGFSCVYVGDDLSTNSPHRNVTYLLDVFHNINGTLTVIGDERFASGSSKIKSLGFLPHNEMMNELTRYHVGLLPWVPHPYHYYCLPNKPIEYAHAGLPTVVTSSLNNVIEVLTPKCCVIFDGFPTVLRRVLSELNKSWDAAWSEEIVAYAKENLIWEKHEGKILEGYSLVL